MAEVKYIDLAGLSHFKSKLDARFPVLGTDGKVPSHYLPSYVDDVVEVSNYAALPSTGEAGKIYVTIDTNKTYRWGGSAYTEISASLALGETNGTAYEGSKGKANAAAIQTLQGYFSGGVANNADKLDGFDANHFVDSSTFQEVSDMVDIINADYVTQTQLDEELKAITGGGGSLGGRVNTLEDAVGVLEGYVPDDIAEGDVFASQQWVLGKKYLQSVPVASDSVIGGIKIGFSQTGKNYPVQLSEGKAYVNVPWLDTTYGLASASVAGLMSAVHFVKLENITTATTAEINALFA